MHLPASSQHRVALAPPGLAGEGAPLVAPTPASDVQAARHLGEASHLLRPFFVLATQNPIEQEGTYPLPEAQLDRFMFMVMVNYPKREDELEVLKRTTGAAGARVRKVIDARAIVELQEIVRRVPVGD